MNQTEAGWVAVAVLGKTRGNRGEITAFALSTKPERFQSLHEVYLFGSGQKAEVETTWFHNGGLIFKFRGVDTISDAERLTGMEVRVPMSERAPLEEDEFFQSDLIGCEVIDRGSGQSLGRVTGWEDGGGSGLLAVGSLLIPFVRAICVEIDPAARRITVELPEAGMLMRDPWLGQGPDGIWHMLWTWGWSAKEMGGRLRIGHASSKDLITWSSQQPLYVMENEPTARNLWAPEAVWDPDHKEWVIFWASTVPGRFPDTEGTGDTGYNHRIYAATTKDWQHVTPARLWFDPGFNCIDSTVARIGNQAGGRWVMVFKDERETPQVKRLRLAFADSLRGPWKDVTEPFSSDWVEGPSAIAIGAEWWIYFDHYAKPQHYGAMRTRDWKTFEDVSSQVDFPADHRHGSVVKISEELARSLQPVSR